MSPPRTRRVALIWIAALALLVWGWQEFWFLCDDAYIAFRYVAARQAGWGYTWNPPPFPAVEGYSSFGWVVLLDLVWSLTGLRPPEAAPFLSLLCVGWTAWTVGQLLTRSALPAAWEPRRDALLVLLLALPLTNRTVFAWASSGLETALWMALLASWARAALRQQTRLTVALAGLLLLTRPDGLLYVGATGLWLLYQTRGQSITDRSLPLLGLVPPAIHLLWRRLTYGVWLPNPYFAKVGLAWPEAGLAHLAYFALEYAAFLWPIPILLARRRPSPGALLVGLSLGAHLAYYVLRVGGDHFEHRIFLPLIWFGWLGVVRSLPALFSLPRQGLLAGGLLVALSWPIPWTHHLRTRELSTRALTHALVEPVAPLLPWMGPWALAWDALQDWLIPHMIAVRHAEHRVLGQLQARRYPDPARVAAGGLSTGGVLVASTLRDGAALIDLRADVGPLLADWPAIDAGTAGMGWFLFPLPVIDIYGLNDPIVGRAPFRTQDRIHAHEVRPPAGYVECFRPNIFTALLLHRITDDRITAVITPDADWSRTLDVERGELPLPAAFAGQPLWAEPGLLLVAREPTFGAAGVEACVGQPWTAPPTDPVGTTVDGMREIARQSAAARARLRGERDQP